MRRLTAVVVFLVLGFVLVSFGKPQATLAQEILIGTGSPAGVYHQVGRAICRLVGRSVTDMSCAARPTAGSLSNLENVRVGALDFGLVQSDLQFHAVQKTGPFEFTDATYESLRALFSVHSEPFTVVARQDSGVTKLDDLRGRSVNLGNPGSGQRATMDVVMDAKGWSKDDFLLAEELPAEQQFFALCHGRIQVMVYTVGHPNESVTKATELCDSRLVEISGPEVEALIAAHPYFAATQIPGGLYRNNPDAVGTFGVKATVVASEDLDDDLAYEITKSIFENLDQFRKMHPAFADLSANKMMREGLSAPLHPGAERYFLEKGMM